MTLPFTREALIGRVASFFLHERVDLTGDGTARFIIDRLSASQTAAIAQAILRDPEQHDRFEIHLPRHYVSSFGLPDHVLTDERATYYRNATIDKPALLLANVGDDEEQSLRDLTAVGTPDLLGRPDLWVSVAGAGLPLTDDQRHWWETALNALQDLRFASLDRYADYVLRTRTHVSEDGLSLIEALGAALPALLLPRRTHAFNEVPDKMRMRTAKFKKVYTSTHDKSACYLSKRKPDGTLLGDEDLRTAYLNVQESIPETLHALVETFLQADAGWTAASRAMSECEWEDIKPLFDGLKRERFNLARETLDFFNEGDPEQLTGDERDYLTRLEGRKTTQAEEEDTQFFEKHRDELRDQRKLKSYWEKFVFGNPKETTDFLSGVMTSLAAFDWGFQGVPVQSRQVVITCDKRNKRDFRDVNVDAGLFFAARYRGLQQLLGSSVRFETGKLFEFDQLVEEWKDKRQELNSSVKKTALQLKFTVELQVVTATGATEEFKARFIWRFNPLWIHSEFPGDLKRLSLHPFQDCVADREPTSNKGRAQSVDLRDVKTLVASYGHERGTLVSKYVADRDLALQWQKNLLEAKQHGWITEATAITLAEQFLLFKDAYTSSVKALREVGLSSPTLEQQAEAYAALLEAICLHAPGDRNRNLLLRPLLALGTVPVRGGRLTAIIAPWHPLRLASLARKAHRFADIVRQLLLPTTTMGDATLFFRDKQEELAHPFSPEVTVVFLREQPALMSLTDTAGDYSLHESPLVSEQGRDETNDNPAEGAERVKELVGRYLALQPHERNSLSVVLYNCDSARLPTAVVGKISALNQDEQDARCQVVLRHRDPKRLRSLYEQIVEGSGDNQDGYVASETTRDFMARLRIGIMADQAPPPDPKDGRPQDIVFLQDVIARHAKLAWYPVSAKPAHPVSLNPAQWSRRRPMQPADMKSVVYLTCPVQTRDGWAYLTAVGSFLTGQWDAPEGTRLIPARELDFRDPEASRILEETHNLGTWVANYDELLDRRQLSEQGVQIIRYKQTGTTGRNLVVSSTAPVGLLRSMVRRRLMDLNLDVHGDDLHALTGRFVADANDVSGDIVLRAAKRGRSASELMGLVLSRYLVRHEIGPDAPVGWFFLDDYAGWLGQREEQIADLMALCPRVRPDGEKELLVVVTEAKYIDAGGLASKRKESAKQLADTLKRVSGALLSDEPRLDREVWLSRLADLLVDGVRVGTNAWLNLAEWARALRDGECQITLRGYSHVFVHGPATEPVSSGAAPIPQVGELDSLQEIFNMEDVQALVRQYAAEQDPMPRREAAGGLVEYSIPWRRQTPLASLIREDNLADLQETTTIDETLPLVSIVLPTVVEKTLFSQISKDQTTSNRTWAYAHVEKWIQESSEITHHAGEAEEWLARVSSTMRMALQQFQLQSKLIGSTLTPNAALLRFQGSASLTVDQVLKRRTEFLTIYSLNVVGVQPQPGEIVISVAREKRENIPVRSLWKRWQPQSDHGNQSLLLGVRENDGNLLILSPGQEHAPHTLIAGSTGSGKSVLMQNIILSIAATNSPNLARITLIDPKQGVDYFSFEDLPHLDRGIVDQQSEALERIDALIQEMDNRYTILRKSRMANVKDYNKKATEDDKLPILWLIHDEFAEWMMIEEYKQHVTSAVARLGVKARAAGIHLVFAAQRPEVSVMPMQLRANLGNRLILRVDSEGTSELALGEKGAERLLGRGHLLARLEGETSAIYAQVPFLEQLDMDRFLEAIKSGSTG